jgi:hypothetical protein
MPADRVIDDQSVYRVEGPFDLAAARGVVEHLRAASGTARVRIDLTRVTEFHDHAVALLARALEAGDGGRTRLVGLRTHQLRLFAYLGVDPAVVGALGHVAASEGSRA